VLLVSCKICEHPNRVAIENALLSISADNPSLTVNTIAEQFGVEIQDLKMHIVMCGALGIPESSIESVSSNSINANPADLTINRDSITKQLKLKEADVLMNVVVELMTTMKNVGRKINELALDVGTDEDGKVPGKYALNKFLSESVVELYIGASSEIRGNIKTLADINQLVHGAENTSTAGIVALTQAIAASSKRANDLTDSTTEQISSTKEDIQSRVS
jgi:hypothetical protein